MNSNLSVLGSTGSIGTQALDVARRLNIAICALAAHSNIDLLERQVREFQPKLAAVFDISAAQELKKRLKDTPVKVVCGQEGLCEAAVVPEANILLNAVVGMAGLVPTLEAIKHTKTVAIANKEALVAGGELIKSAAKAKNIAILPVDSEHSAIFQCLQGCPERSYVKKLILTASGGPFLGKSAEQLKYVTLKDALKHPNWSMGKKITVDSASLMNKGLEVIEAVQLFDISPDSIEVLIHRESVIHSMVQYQDNSIIAQLSSPDMRLPIQYALTWPQRQPSPVEELNLADIKNLSFEKPDEQTFPLLTLCKKAIKIGGTAPAFICSANEVAVDLFLQQKISFLQIMELVIGAFGQYIPEQVNSLADILKADKKARDFIYSSTILCGLKI